eukprot:1159932-Pelagomonas_calceolata.AAC.7
MACVSRRRADRRKQGHVARRGATGRGQQGYGMHRGGRLEGGSRDRACTGGAHCQSWQVAGACCAQGGHWKEAAGTRDAQSSTLAKGCNDAARAAQRVRELQGSNVRSRALSIKCVGGLEGSNALEGLKDKMRWRA